MRKIELVSNRLNEFNNHLAINLEDYRRDDGTVDWKAFKSDKEGETKESRLVKAEYQPIYQQDLSTPDARRSQPVSYQQFQQIAAEGHKRYNNLVGNSTAPTGLDNNWNNVVSQAYQSTREPWGGSTVDSHTGKPLAGNEDAYALTIRNPDQQAISVHPQASLQEFTGAMNKARQQYADKLGIAGGHLGIFHDADKGTIDIDPTYVTKDKSDVDTIGAYTRALGGAYHFQSGDGFWPPHVTQ